MDNMLVAHYRQLAAAALVAFASSAPIDAEPFKVEAETIQNISERLHECWVPPVQNSHPGMEITVRLSFKSNGVVLGRPRITFETPHVTEAQRLSYRISVAEMLVRCTPIPVSSSLGEAIAGRPFTIRFHDRRAPSKLPHPGSV
jgi:hypothetical protein